MQYTTAEALAKGYDILKMQSGMDPSWVATLPITDGMRILDVGCYKGRDLRWIFFNFPKCELYGVDKQQVCIDHCQQTHADTSIKWFCVDGSSLPFSDGFFDLVFSNGLDTDVSPEEWINIEKEMNRVGKKVVNGSQITN